MLVMRAPTPSVPDLPLQNMPEPPRIVLPTFQPIFLAPCPPNFTTYPSMPHSLSFSNADSSSSYPAPFFPLPYYPTHSQSRSISPSYTLSPPSTPSNVSCSLHGSDIFFSDSD